MDLVECREFQFSFSGTWWHSSKESRYRELWKTNRILVFFVVGFKFENTHRNQYLTLEVQSQKSKKVGLSLV